MDANPLCLFWKGFTPAHHEFLDPQTLFIRLEPNEHVPPVCSGCDHACFLVHDVHRRWVREAPMQISHWDLTTFYTRPLSLTLCLLVVLALAYPLWNQWRRRRSSVQH